MTTIYVSEESLGPSALPDDVELFVQYLEAELPDNADVRVVKGAGLSDELPADIQAAHDRAWERFCGISAQER